MVARHGGETLDFIVHGKHGIIKLPLNAEAVNTFALSGPEYNLPENLNDLSALGENVLSARNSCSALPLRDSSVSLRPATNAFGIML